MKPKKPLKNRNLFRLDSKNTHGWQVRFIVNGEHLSKFFNDNKYGGNENALKEARSYRNEMEKLVLEEREPISRRRYIHTETVANNKSGIIGINRTTDKERSGNYTDHWQTSWINAKGKVTTRRRAVKKWGEVGALLKVINIRISGLKEVSEKIDNSEAKDQISNMIDYYKPLVEYLEKIEPNEEELLSKILSQKEQTETERVDLINSRIGQLNFRKKVLNYWDQKCCITGCSTLLVASHIKPWSDCSNKEKLDPFNGLSLSPNYDKAFDKGFISFKETGRIMVSATFKDDAELLNIRPQIKIKGLTPLHDHYLKYHRKNIFAK